MYSCVGLIMATGSRGQSASVLQWNHRACFSVMWFVSGRVTLLLQPFTDHAAECFSEGCAGVVSYVTQCFGFVGYSSSVCPRTRSVWGSPSWLPHPSSVLLPFPPLHFSLPLLSSYLASSSLLLLVLTQTPSFQWIRSSFSGNKAFFQQSIHSKWLRLILFCGAILCSEHLTSGNRP